MPDRLFHNETELKQSADLASACTMALAETCKALKAFSFYPESHPLRGKIIGAGYQAVAGLVRDGGVSFLVQRNGFSLSGEEGTLANTPMTAALAQELFAREIQRLTLLPDLSPADFNGFIAALATDPQKVSAAGGLGAMLKNEGIRSITVNEIDITAVFNKRKVGVTEAASAKGTPVGEDAEADEAESELNLPNHQRAPEEEISIDDLVAGLAAETDDNAYRQLARKLVVKAQPLKLDENFDRLYPILLAMAQQRADEERSPVQRDCALVVLQQLGLGEPAEHLLDHLEDEEYSGSEQVCLVLAQIGAEVVDAVVARVVAAGSKPSRNLLGTVLSRIGRPALAPLTALLRDERPQVVQSAVIILGELGLRDAVKSLAVAALHFDDRVRMEAIRSLARIGGMEATRVLLDLLHEGDDAVAVQVITWLGNTRNHSAVQPLLQLVMKRDAFGKTHHLKKAALSALGRIADPRALEPLIKLVKKRHLLMARRWDELKLVALDAIARIGGNTAQEFLEKVAAKGGQLGNASSAALARMEQRKAARNA